MPPKAFGAPELGPKKIIRFSLPLIEFVCSGSCTDRPEPPEKIKLFLQPSQIRKDPLAVPGGAPPKGGE